MALLNPPGILPNVARAIYRYLLQANEQREEDERLQRILAPRSLFLPADGDADEADKVTKGRERAYGPTLRSCIELGLLMREGSFIGLNPKLPTEALAPRDGDQRFVRTMRDLVLHPDNNKGEWGSLEGARDLTLGLAWFEMQDVFNPPGTWEGTRNQEGTLQLQTRQLNDLILRNDTRWWPFARWSRFLGFTWQMGFDASGVLIPDPTTAVQETLSQVFGSRRQLPIRKFIEGLSAELPVLDGGIYRQEVERHVKEGLHSIPTDSLSSSLGHALVVLEEKGEVRLSDKADAESVALSTEPETRRTVSHVELASKEHSRDD